MTIDLQTNNSEKNALSKDIDTIASLTGTLRAECSIIDPVIIVEADLSDLTGCNYMTIEDFSRSYFINNIRTIRENLVEISAHVDVLSSFKDEILANEAIILRQENLWNLYLNDGTFKVYQNQDVVTAPFPNGFTTQQFILAVAGA